MSTRQRLTRLEKHFKPHDVPDWGDLSEVPDRELEDFLRATLTPAQRARLDQRVETLTDEQLASVIRGDDPCLLRELEALL